MKQNFDYETGYEKRSIFDGLHGRDEKHPGQLLRFGGGGIKVFYIFVSN